MSWHTDQFVSFDLETTGVDVETDRIVTATIVWIGGSVVEPREWLINPGVDIPQAAIDVHGVTNEHAQAEGADPAEALNAILAELDLAWGAHGPVVIYNASFDLSILDRELRRHCGTSLDGRIGAVIDPFVIDKHRDPYRKGKRTLTATCEHYQVKLDGGAHVQRGRVGSGAVGVAPRGAVPGPGRSRCGERSAGGVACRVGLQLRAVPRSQGHPGDCRRPLAAAPAAGVGMTLNYTIRPISDRTWFRPSAQRERSRFTASWSDTLSLLERELVHLDARNMILELDVREQDIRNDGQVRANARPATTQAVVVAFDSKHGPLQYRSDIYDAVAWGAKGTLPWQHNVRAIALTLEALRAVDRYGASRRGEQYRGYKAIGGGDGAIATGMTTDTAYAIVANEAKAPNGTPLTPAMVRAAKANTHPDRNNGARAAYDAVDQAVQVLERAGRI